MPGEEEEEYPEEERTYYNGVLTGILIGIGVCGIIATCLTFFFVFRPHFLFMASAYHDSEMIVFTREGVYDCDTKRDCLLLTRPYETLKHCECGDEFELYFHTNHRLAYYYTNITHGYYRTPIQEVFYFLETKIK